MKKNIESLKQDIFAVKHFKLKTFLMCFSLLLIILISLFLGRYDIDPIKLIEDFFSHIFKGEILDNKIDTVLFNIRIPRIFVVLLVGAGLSLSGTAYQGMFKNPLVSPDLLGASQGAAFGAVLALVLNQGMLMVQISAFSFGILSVIIVVFINKIVKVDAILGYILGGILIGMVFQSGMSILKILADASDKLPSITFWLMGSFSSIILKDLLIILPPMIIGFFLLLTQFHKLNALSFGDDEARALGVNTKRTRLVVIVGATLLTATSVSIAGVIGFVGLIVPHITRAIVGPNFRSLFLSSSIIGAAFLLIVDDFSRTIFATEIPIGVVTSIIGAPFFIMIYSKNMKGW